MALKKILLIDSPHPYFKQTVESKGFVCDVGDNLSRDKIVDRLGDYFGVVIKSRFNIDKAFIDQAKKLHFIARVGAGTDHIDVDYAKSMGISCITSPEGNRDALAEHAMGMILSLLNHLCHGNWQIKQGIWDREKNRGHELQGKTMGIIGYGNMGSAFAKRLKGFGMQVIAYDKYKFDYSDEYVTEVSLDQIFKESDFLSLHVPLTDETHYMLDNDFVSQFRKKFYLINTARGRVVKTEDLVRNLKSGKIKGAALDVLEFEEISYQSIDSSSQPAVFDYLCNAENVILSPHVAGLTMETDLKHAEVLANKIMTKFGESQ